MIKLVQPQITDLKYRKKLLKDIKSMGELLILMKKYGSLGISYG